MAGGAKELCCASFLRALVSFMRTLPSWPNHISKAILLNSKTWRLYVNTLISGRHKHSDHSRIFESESRSVLSTLCSPMDWSTGFSRPEYWSGWPFPSPGDLPNPGIGPRSPTLQADSSPAEPPGKPKNTGMGSLSLLQRIFLTQESNWGLLHCRIFSKSYFWLKCNERSQQPESEVSIASW